MNWNPTLGSKGCSEKIHCRGCSEKMNGPCNPFTLGSRGDGGIGSVWLEVTIAREESDSGTNTKRMKTDLVQSPPAVPTMKPVLASPVPTTKPASASSPRTPIKESTPAPRTLKEPTSAPTSPSPKSTAEAAPPPLPPSTAELAPPLSPPSTAEPAPAPPPPPAKSAAEPAPPAPTLTTSDEGSDQKGFHRELTKDEYKAYLKQVRESDGFDVKNLPRCTLLAPIQPVRMDSLPDCFDLKLYSQRALDEYNRRFQGELEFVKILKVMCNALRYFHFYITLEAKDLADGGNIKTYQTRVKRVSKDDCHVLSFRLKPPQDEQGSSNQAKEWFCKEPC